jgi:hypothetical protein
MAVETDKEELVFAQRRLDCQAASILCITHMILEKRRDCALTRTAISMPERAELNKTFRGPIESLKSKTS